MYLFSFNCSLRMITCSICTTLGTQIQERYGEISRECSENSCCYTYRTVSRVHHMMCMYTH